MTAIWPIDTLPPRHIQADPVGVSISGTAAISGFVQATASDAGAWLVRLGEFPVLTKQKVLLWRSLAALFDGRLNPVLVQIADHDRPPFPGSEIIAGSIAHSDGTLFSDDTGYHQPLIIVDVQANAALRATQIQLNAISASDLLSGQRFSIGERFYEIKKIVSKVGNIYTVDLRIPLREAIVAGQRAEFDRPVCKLRLASDDQMNLPLDFNRWGFPSITLFEDVS